jgi:hypothetical protein
MSMVGGAPSQFGFDKTVGGIAPYGGTVLRDAFVFVFETPHGSTQTLCETAAHEIGHALGLDHTRLCNDVMSYERCGNKEFHDQRVACGEWNDRRCSDGSNSQSSWGKLAQLVGVRNESEAPSVSEPRPPASTTATRPKAPAPVASTDPRRQPTHGSGRSGRSLRVRPATSVAPGSLYVVEVDARDSDGIRDVDLVWYDSRARRLRCSDAKVSDAFLCYRRGNTYTFVLRVGQGTRRFYASVTDGKGTTARSKTYTVRFQ